MPRPGGAGPRAPAALPTLRTGARGRPRVRGRIVITDAEQRCVLAAARALASANFDVTVLGTAPKQLTLWSRACHHRELVTDPRVDQAGFRDDLAALLQGGDYDVVIPGTEQSMLVLADAEPGIFGAARHGIPDGDTVRRCLDRRVLGEAAAGVGIPSPPGVACDTGAAALEAARLFGYDVIVKPARSVHVVGAGLVWRKSAFANGREACRRTIARFEPPLLIQHQVAHRAVLSFSGVFYDGRLHAACLSRYRRSWPPQGGVAAFAETVVPSPGHVAAISALVAAIGWTGIFEVEMLDRGEGRAPAAIDFNPRLFGTIALPIAAGANLPAAWCRLLLGERPASSWAAPQVGYRFEEGDLRFLLREARSRRLASALRAARPHRHTAHAIFDRRDPLPFAAWGLSRGGAVRPPRAAAVRR